jgi:3-hydroxyisobutyrate dehydrogenase-like beta-hydroxyacid dehydrogenase
MAAAAELLNAAEQQALDLDRVFERLSGMVPILNARRRGLLGRDHSNPTFEVNGACKDLDLALRAAHATAAPLPVTAAAREVFEFARRRHPVDEMSAVREVFGEG